MSVFCCAAWTPQVCVWVRAEQRRSQGAGRPRAIYPQTRAPLGQRGKPLLGQRLLKPRWLLTVISSWVCSPQPASRAIGCLLLPIKTHKCVPAAHAQWYLCACRVCLCIWEWEEWRSRVKESEMRRFCQWWEGSGDGAKRFGGFSSATPSVQAGVQAIKGTCWENQALTSSQIIKSVYIHRCPEERKIPLDESSALCRRKAGSSGPLKLLHL